MADAESSNDVRDQRSGDRQGDDVALIRSAATQLRGRVARHRAEPVGEYAQFGAATLLDAIAVAIADGDPVAPEVRVRAVELARHVHAYPPPEPTGDA